MLIMRTAGLDALRTAKSRRTLQILQNTTELNVKFQVTLTIFLMKSIRF